MKRYVEFEARPNGERMGFIALVVLEIWMKKCRMTLTMAQKLFENTSNRQILLDARTASISLHHYEKW